MTNAYPPSTLVGWIESRLLQYEVAGIPPAAKSNAAPSVLQKAVADGRVDVNDGDVAIFIGVSVVTGSVEVLLIIPSLEVLFGRIAEVVEFIGIGIPVPDGTNEVVEFIRSGLPVPDGTIEVVEFAGTEKPVPDGICAIVEFTGIGIPVPDGTSEAVELIIRKAAEDAVSKGSAEEVEFDITGAIDDTIPVPVGRYKLVEFDIGYEVDDAVCCKITETVEMGKGFSVPDGV